VKAGFERKIPRICCVGDCVAQRINQDLLAEMLSPPPLLVDNVPGWRNSDHFFP
jgi:hypothetical protein